MKINEVLAISGKSGLYRYVAGSKNGIIVESLGDSKRMMMPQTAKISTFGDIAVFTYSEDIPLTEVLQKMSEAFEGKECVDHKSDDKTLIEAFSKALPDYDKERVRVSDIKKIVSWYNTLVSIGITDFTTEEEEEQAE